LEKRESKCGQRAIANFVTVGKGRTEQQRDTLFLSINQKPREVVVVKTETAAIKSRSISELNYTSLGKD